MDGFIATCVVHLNAAGRQFCDYAGAMLLQVGVLVVLLLAADVLLHKHIRATLRYWLWILVFIKLLLPPTLCVPTGIGYWRGDLVRLSPAVPPQGMEATRWQALPERPASVEKTARADFSAGRAHSDAVAMGMKPGPAAGVASVHPTWQGVAFLLWVAGMLALAGWVVQRALFVRRLTVRGHPADGPLTDVLEVWRRRVGLRTRVELRLTTETSSPAVCGLLRPVILLPAALLEKVTPGGLEAVLIHELAHVKRGDLWLNCLQTTLQIVYFYNPLVWLAGAMVRRVREQAVDEMVLVALGAEARSYSRTLVDIAEMAFARVSPALGLIGVAESKKSLERRIKHMVTRPTPRNARVGLRGSLIVLAAGALLLPMAQAQSAKNSPADDGDRDSGVVATIPENGTADGEHRITAPPLTDFERSLVAEVLALARQVAQEYPGQATNWPAGPGLYHVDARGQVTVWQYQELWRRNADCTADEVGWGSSQAVEATGMYYLPDGTPLSSRWRERGDGMKDIRVKVGRPVGADERVALIHRRGLSGAHDLWSRAGGERTILLDPYRHQPVKIVVRVDAPLRLGGGWTGEPRQVEVQNFDDYDRLLVSGPPQENPGPILATIQVPEEAAPGPRVEEKRQELEEAIARLRSAGRLNKLGKAMLVYANDHGGRLPEGIEYLLNELEQDDLQWLLLNVTYLGRGLSATGNPARVIAYDKTLLAWGHGTNVLYLDAHVVFEKPEELKKLGIPPIALKETERVAVMNHLKQFALAMLLYADDHQGTYAPSVQEAKPYLGEEGEFTWAVENIGYLGAGAQRSTVTSPATRPLAYWKTAPPTGDGTAVAFFDGHVEWVPADRLLKLGIPAAQGGGQGGAGGPMDYASAVVRPGVGFDDIIVGDRDSTMARVKSKLGPPDRQEDRWLGYGDKYGLDFMFGPSGVLGEIRMNPGFRGRLTSGISLASSQTDVFEEYGRPVAERSVDDLHRQNEDRVLFRRGDVSRIYYGDAGLIFWFKGHRITQIVTFPKRPEAQKPGEGN